MGKGKWIKIKPEFIDDDIDITIHHSETKKQCPIAQYELFEDFVSIASENYTKYLNLDEIKEERKRLIENIIETNAMCICQNPPVQQTIYKYLLEENEK